RMPGAGWSQLVAAIFMAGFFLLLSVKLVVPALISAFIFIIACIVWGWKLDHGPDKGPVDIGAGIILPTYMSGHRSHAWWAMMVLIVVASSLYLAYLFSYLYLWVVSP